MYCPACRGETGEPERFHADSGEITYTCPRCASRPPDVDKHGIARTGLPPTPAVLCRAWMCGHCAKEQPVVMALSKTGQICAQCPECESQFGRALSEPIRDSARIAGEKASPSALRSEDRRAAPDTVRQESSRGHVGVGRMQTSPIAPGDIIGQVRARVADLDMELARLEGLRIERKQLMSMLRAADKIAAQQAALLSVATLMSDATDTRQ